jgi:hypothetical protein
MAQPGVDAHFACLAGLGTVREQPFAAADQVVAGLVDRQHVAVQSRLERIAQPVVAAGQQRVTQVGLGALVRDQRGDDGALRGADHGDVRCRRACGQQFVDDGLRGIRALLQGRAAVAHGSVHDRAFASECGDDVVEPVAAVFRADRLRALFLDDAAVQVDDVSRRRRPVGGAGGGRRRH